ELGAVVAVDALRQATLEPKSLERGDDIPTAQALPHVDRQAFPREEIAHGQRAKPSAIRELVGPKVHAPDVIPSRGGSSRLAGRRRRVSPRTLPPKRQSLPGVEAIAAFLPERPAFAPEQDEEPAIAESHAGLRQLPQPLPQGRQRVTAALIANAR